MNKTENSYSKKIAQNYLYNILYQGLILILPFITTPYIARVLGPEKEGMYAGTNAITQYFILFGCVGLNLYGQREIAYKQKSIYERSVAFFELVIIRIICMLISISIFLVTVCNDPKYGFLYRIEILELIAAMFDFSWLFQGMEEFKKIVVRNSMVKVLAVLCIVLFVNTQNDLPIYTLILTSSILIGNLLLFIYVPRYIIKVDKKSLNIRRHIKPALALFIPQIATSVYNILDKSMIEIISRLDAEVSFYEQSQKIVKMALAIPTAVGTVMLPRVSSMFGSGDTKKIYEYIIASMKFVCLLAFPLCAGIIAISKGFVPWFYGPGYEKVIINLRVIAPIIVFVSMSNVLGVQFLLPTNRQKEYSMSVMIGTAVNFIFNLMLIKRYLSIGAAIGSVLAELSVTVSQIVILHREIPLYSCVKSITRYLLASCVMYVIVTSFAGLFSRVAALYTILEILVGIISYFLCLILLKDELLFMFFSRRTKNTVIE